MFSALVSALSSAGGLIIDKIILAKRGVPLKVFIPVVFVFLFVLTLVFTPFYGYIHWQQALQPSGLFLLILMAIIAMAWNVLVCQSLQRESLHQHEVIIMTGPIVTIVLAAIFFQSEFNLTVFVLAVIASLAMLIARAEPRHFKFDKMSYNLFLAVVLMSVENIIIRELLHAYSPVALYAVRTLILAIFFGIYYRPSSKEMAKSPLLLIGLSAAIGVISMVTKFYAFESLGVIYTTLISTLMPIVVFLGSWEILHERIRPRVVVASIIILACVVVATVLTSQG